ncbi:MAG: hypothetical protein AAFN74_02235 [Myxococcota bacterium]
MSDSRELLTAARANALLRFRGQASVAETEREAQRAAFNAGVNDRFNQMSAELPSLGEGTDGALVYGNLAALLALPEPAVEASPALFYGSRGGVGSFDAEVRRLQSRINSDATQADADGEGDLFP